MGHNRGCRGQRKPPGVNLEPIEAQQGSFNCQFVESPLKRDDGSVP
jgi:hypothetical protein